MEDEEEASSAAAVSSASATPAPSGNSDLSAIPASQAFNWSVGSRLESKARDSNGGEQWFPAKVLEVEAERILVHYMQWNARHDEWIPSNSSRLRPVTSSSGRSSRHNSGGDRMSVENNINTDNESNAAVAVSPMPMPAHKDFKPGDKVMATWKLNRKYLATVRKYESSDGTYLVEFYDGVTMNVKPNNMRRPRKGEETDHEQESLKINGVDNESAENSEAEENGSINNSSSTQSSSTARRERKRKFDVKQLLNIRTVKSLRSNSQEDSVETPNNPKNEKRKRRLVSEQKSNNSESAAPTTPNVLNGCKGKPKLEDGPAMAAVSGKRERRKKKFWDEEVDSLKAIPSSIATTSSSKTTPSPSSSTSSTSTVSALKRKSSVSSVASSSRKSSKKSSDKQQQSTGDASNDQDLVKSNGSGVHDVSEHVSEASSKQQPSGKENGKLLPYLQFDLSDDPELIAEKMVEGVNIPGMGQPIPVDSSSLPEGWEKRVIQRRIGITKGKWDVFITNPETGKSFRSKTELQKHLDERKLPYTSDAFDFSLDDNLKKLRQIWKQYKVKPFLNNPKGTASTNYRHVPAKITQVTDSDILAASGGHNRGGSHHGALTSPLTSSSAGASSGATSTTVDASTPAASSVPSSVALMNNVKQNISPPLLPTEGSNAEENWAGLAEIAVESETGQGLRCSINKCGKLFRNNRLLRQHVKHYHPKVYDSLVCKHPGIGAEDISEPTSPEASSRRWSESIDQDYQENMHQINSGGSSGIRRRKPSSETVKRTSETDHIDHMHLGRSSNSSSGSKKRSIKRSTLDEEAPLSSMYDDDEEVFFTKRTRNDSVPSSVNSDAEDISVSGDHSFSQSFNHYQQQSHPRSSSSGNGPHCPPTPPTFRLSKRRQAQMRKRVSQPIIRMSKIEDTPLGRDYREELLSLATSVNSVASPTAVSGMSLSSATSPNGSVQDGMGLNNQPQSYPPSEMDASVAGSEHLTSEELVNCTCRRLEEDGLMIQCDICLCWQHGYCVGIEDEDPVPEKHVCETCRQPTGGRSDARFSLDQDWLKEGKLPSIDMCSTKSKSSLLVAANEKETAFRKLSELMADLSHLDKILHGLRVKLHVASQPNNNKVFMWSSVWSLPTVVQSSVELEEESVPPLPSSEEAVQPPNHHYSGLLLEATTTNNGKDHHNGQAVDPQAVADKLNLIKEGNEQASNGPSFADAEESAKEENVVTNDTTSQVTEKVENSDEHDAEDSQQNCDKNSTTTTTTMKSSTPKPLSNSKQEVVAVDTNSDVDKQPTKSETSASENETAPLTNGNKLEEDKEEEEKNKTPAKPSSTSSSPPSNNHVQTDQDQVDPNNQDLQGLDASFIPSVYEVERLLPSVLQAMEATKDPTVPKPSTSKAAVIIPEPKRLDRDECRLNLLTHIESVQNEIEKRFTAIEEALGKIESMPGAFHAGLTPAQLQVGENRIKSKLTMLIQDLAIARQLMWTL